jgi:hypothetical protein
VAVRAEMSEPLRQAPLVQQHRVQFAAACPFLCTKSFNEAHLKGVLLFAWLVRADDAPKSRLHKAHERRVSHVSSLPHTAVRFRAPVGYIGSEET